MDDPEEPRVAAAADQSASGDKPVVIKKYANRRLYNTATSAYVTLDHLAEMVRQGQDFVVYDAKTGEDITRSVLTQIIFEEESRGQSLLPIQFLRQLIGFYGDQVQAVLPSYLELSLENFARQQDAIRAQMTKAMGTNPAAAAFEEQMRQNTAMFQQAMKMFSPFAYRPAEAPGQAQDQAPAEPAQDVGRGAAGGDPALDEMRRELEALRARLDGLAGGKK
ncbi:polyhydroxyalkanoate synthesis repressor PhaR [Brevundimonas sp. 2R-24]|uniref:Polyhydroxyalkanoate synthesis repressor PhaR n=1 Tax=Peiella sedimenti TaxID=3061083 RepID=A0ABT8SH11_9CAUL|nr:polyhydroxyalkanoate synthesis repressor PhaR [Caulobacteraceae bacterium XZ-24]